MEKSEVREYGHFAAGVCMRLVAIVVSLASSVVTARGLGVAGRGILYTCTATSALAAQLLALGMPSAGLLAVAASPSLGRRGVRLGFLSALTAGAGFALLAGFFVQWARPGWIPPELPGVVQTVAALLSGQILLTWCSSIMLGLGQVNRLPVLEFIYRAITLAWCWYALFGLKVSISVFLWSLAAVDLAAGSAWMLYLYVRSPRAAAPSQWPAEWFRWSARAFPLPVLNTAVRRVDLLMLTSLCGPRATGLYSVAVQTLDLSQIPSVFLGQKALHSFSSGIGDTPVIRRLRRSLPALVFGCMALAAVTADLWSPALFGEEFRGVGPFVLALAIGAGVLAWETVAVQEVAAAGYPSSLTLSWLVCLGIEVILIRMLAPGHGAVGVGVALSSCYAVLSVLVLWIRGGIRARAGAVAPE